MSSTENLANAAPDEDADNTWALTLPATTEREQIVCPIPARAAERATFLQADDAAQSDRRRSSAASTDAELPPAINALMHHVPYDPRDALFAPVEPYDVHQSLDGALRTAPHDQESAWQVLEEINRALEEGAVPRYTPSPSPTASNSSWNRAPSPVKTEEPIDDVELAWSRAPSPVRSEEFVDEGDWNSNGENDGSDTQGSWSRGALSSPALSESPVSSAHHEPYDPHNAIFAPVEAYNVHESLRGGASDSHRAPHESDKQRAWQALEEINRAIEEGSVPWYRHSPSPTASNYEWSRATSPLTVKSEEEVLDEVDLEWSRAPSPVRSDEEGLGASDWNSDGDSETHGSGIHQGSRGASSPALSVPYDPHDALFAPVEAYDVHASLGGASHSAPSRDNDEQESAWEALEEINRAIRDGELPRYTPSPSPVPLPAPSGSTSALAWNRAPSPVHSDGAESDGDGESLYGSETQTRIFDPYTETWTSVSLRAMSPASTYSSGPDYYSEAYQNEHTDLHDQEEVRRESTASISPSVEEQRSSSPAGHDDLSTRGATSSSSRVYAQSRTYEMKKRGRSVTGSDDGDNEGERAVKRRRSASPLAETLSNASGSEDTRPHAGLILQPAATQANCVTDYEFNDAEYDVESSDSSEEE